MANTWKALQIGNKRAQVPIIQGGMGVGVSMGNLAGAVAAEGAVGIISTAQIGFYRKDFNQNPSAANVAAIHEQIQKARSIAKSRGLIGVNIMVALKDFSLHVKEAAKAGADLIISGAGLPIDLPKLVEGYDVKLAPIVSSLRAARLIFKKWKKSYQRVPDLVVIEGPKAGGHLGFAVEDLVVSDLEYEEEIKKIIEFVNQESENEKKEIPVVVAGGIFEKEDIEHAFSLGASGVQMASRFVCTRECDASEAYKQAYIKAREEDSMIIKSPVGMPGRALKNKFTQITKTERYPITKCRGCLAKCNPSEIPYCITDALIRAVKGDTEMGLVFCGANVGKINHILSVHDLISELIYS